MITEKPQIRTHEELFVHVYQTAFPKVALFVKKLGGTFEEAKDVFQDALVIYYEKKVDRDFSSQHDTTQYLLGIARHLWYKKYHENKLQRSLDSLPELKWIEDEPRVSENILRFAALSGKKCMDLLKSFYYDKLNMKDLAEKFGFSGERSATTQKYKCLEKVREAIKERSLNKEDFYD